MYSTRLIHLLLVALGLVAAVQATQIDNRSPAKGPALQVRQDEGGTSQDASGTPSAAPSETGGGATEPTQTPDPTTEQTTTNAPPTTSNQGETTPTPSDTPQPTPTPSDPTTTPSTSQQTTEGNNQQTTTNNNDQETTTTPEPSTWTTVIVVHSTAENGDVVSYTSPSQIVSTPTLSANEDNTGGGMPTATRNIVIGVVGGVGGAIALGALGFVAWRIWGRKRKSEENDGLMDYHTAGTSAFGSEPKPDAASSTAASRSPFQTTLEDYHRPGQVNASSNF